MCFDNSKKIHINLGCGRSFNNYKSAENDIWINIDKADYGQDVIRDIRKGLPFCDNAIDEILVDNVLEHIEPNEDFIFLMNECLRILKNEGKMNIIVPYFSSKMQCKDPTHCRFFAEETFIYLEKENSWLYGFDKRWKIEKCERLGEVLKVILIAKKNE